jgi:hypothetical protein
MEVKREVADIEQYLVAGKVRERLSVNRVEHVEG